VFTRAVTPYDRFLVLGLVAPDLVLVPCAQLVLVHNPLFGMVLVYSAVMRLLACIMSVFWACLGVNGSPNMMGLVRAWARHSAPGVVSSVYMVLVWATFPVTPMVVSDLWFSFAVLWWLACQWPVIEIPVRLACGVIHAAMVAGRPEPRRLGPFP
jgi:hypothetical protein